jgi:hypothetical protein
MTDFNFPKLYLFAFILLVVFASEALLKRHRLVWSIPALAIYATTAMWYLVESIYSPEALEKFSDEIIDSAYTQIILFLIAFRLFLPDLCRACLNKVKVPRSTIAFRPDRLLICVAIVWLGLLLFGISRLGGDFLGALFPVNSRSGVQMWQRSAAGGAGSTGFIISSAAYIYNLVCAFFFVLLPLQTKKEFKLLNLSMVLISLPYFILMGARNRLLAVILPGYFSYTLFSQDKVWKKVIISILSITILNYIMTAIIAYRNIGFESFFDPRLNNNISLGHQKHLGLNMLEELCFINTFYQDGLFSLKYGEGYIAELANVIPRAIWANKPLVGIDYAILRGFGGSSADIGVFATISTGFIGQGIINFGPYFGAIAPSFLLALWTGFLSRLWVQRESVLRRCLFLVGLGLTFNLGRDLTLLTLWPMVFGYLFVRFLENLSVQPTQHKL